MCMYSNATFYSLREKQNLSISAVLWAFFDIWDRNSFSFGLNERRHRRRRCRASAKVKVKMKMKTKENGKKPQSRMFTDGNVFACTVRVNYPIHSRHDKYHLKRIFTWELTISSEHKCNSFFDFCRFLSLFNHLHYTFSLFVLSSVSSYNEHPHTHRHTRIQCDIFDLVCRK